jgi:hypothetical protein
MTLVSGLWQRPVGPLDVPDDPVDLEMVRSRRGEGDSRNN